jgi:hypothetical protein
VRLPGRISGIRRIGSLLAASLVAVLAAGGAGAGGIQLELLGAGRSLWVVNGSQVLRVDASDGRVLARPRVGGSYPLELALGGGAVWVSSVENGFVAGALSRIDLATGRVTTALRVRDGIVGDVAFAGGSAWALVGPTDSARLVRVDAATGRRVASLRAGRSPAWMAADESSVWVSDPARALLRVDPRTGRVRTVLRSSGVGPVTAGFGDAWVEDRHTLARVGGRTGRVIARVPLAASVLSLAAGPHAVWALVHDRRRAALVRIDPRSNRITARQVLSGSPTAVAVAAGGVWVGALRPAVRLLRIDTGTLRVRATVALS